MTLLCPLAGKLLMLVSFAFRVNPLKRMIIIATIIIIVK